MAEGNGGGEQCAAGPLLAACGTTGDALYLYSVQVGRRGRGEEQCVAGLLPVACGTPGGALYLLHCAGWQKGMVVVNNVLLGRYWSRVGP